MDRCTTCQNQMLEFVYAVVDDDVRAEMAAHLASCVDCQAALAEAQSQQQLLAAAARVEFPAVAFAPPVEVAQEVAVVPFRAPQRPQVRPAGAAVSWRRWLAAAAILLTLAAPAWIIGDYAATNRKLEREESAVASIDAKIRANRGELEKLAQNEAKEKDARAKEIRQSEKSIEISGPATYEPGAQGKLLIRTINGENQPIKGTLKSITVVDLAAGNKVLREEKDKATTGTYEFVLPPDLAVQPDSRVAVRVVLANTGGAPAEMTDYFELQPKNYLTHLATDKPMYQPGEVVRFRALSLERFNLHPASEQLDLRYQVLTPVNGVIDIPPGDINRLVQQGEADGWAAFGKQNSALRGISGGEWRIPQGFTGGEYSLVVSEARNRFTAQTRKFTVNVYRKPRLNKELDFTRKSYGPGDTVIASCKASTVEGPVARCPVHVTVSVDNKIYGADGKESNRPIDFRTDDQGKVNVQFKLPAEMERGLGSVNVEFDDGGGSDPLTKPLPIVLNKLDVEFFPEGGYLVAGTPNRVYFQVRTMHGKPAELKGRLVNDNGLVVANLETLADDKEPGANQGMGVFSFTPEKDRKYQLRIDRPIGMKSEHKLDTSVWGEVGLTIPSSVTTAYQPIEARVRSVGQNRTLLVGAYCRGRMFDHKRVDVKAGHEESVTLDPVQGIGGVYRITVFEELNSGTNHAQLIPRAERLIFRQHRDRLNLEAVADNKELAPGATAKVRFTARGEKQEAIQAALMVSVVDKALLTLADEKTARTMPTHFYLMSDVGSPEDLEYTDFLLTAHAKAATALDMLLGTQGWRRIVEGAPGELRDRLQEQAKAMAAAIVPTELPRVTKDRNAWDQQAQMQAKIGQEWERIDAAVRPERLALEQREAELQQSRAAAARTPEYLAVREKVNSYHEFALRLQPWFPVVAIFLMVAGCLLLARAFARPAVEAVPSVAIAVVCLAVVVVGGVFTFTAGPPRNLSGEATMVARQDGPRDILDARDKQAGEWTHSVRPDTRDDQTEAIRLNNEPRRGADPKAEKPSEEAGTLFPAPVSPPSAPTPTVAPGTGGFGGVATGPAGSGLGGVPPGPGGPGGFGLGGGFAGGGAGMPGKPALGVPTGQFGAGRDKTRLLGDSKRLDEGKGLMPADRAPATKPGALRGKEDAERFRDDSEKKKDKEAESELRTYRRQQARELLLKNVDKDGAGLDDNRNLRKELMDRNLDQAPFFLREYGHKRRTGGGDVMLRSDLADTVFWHPALLLSKGQGEVAFELSDAVTLYEVTVFGHTQDGRLAATKTTINSRLPLVVTASVPTEVTATDRPIASVTVTNATPAAVKATVEMLNASGMTLAKGKTDRVLDVGAKSQARSLFRLEPSVKEGEAHLSFAAEVKQQGKDMQESALRIVPEGFPVQESRGDLLEGGAARQTIDLPSTWISGTLEAKVQLYPSTLADLQKGLEGLLREPYGCFEQTSTANYPNVMILDYLQTTGQVNPEAEKRARQLLEKGYQKLTSFECESDSRSRRGYEWFGGKAPPHEVLSAYGLMQFRDMTRLKATEVDQAMMERTRQFLLGQRDGQGGFKRNPKALDTFGRAPQHITNAYIVWALTESGPDDVDLELKALADQAQKSDDPYFLSLVANSLVNRGKTADAVKLLAKVAKAQKDDGRLEAKETSITGSGGRDLQIETTSLAMLGWLKADPGGFNAAVQKAVKWIGQQRGGHGAFGSTQATILALRALIAYTAKNKWPAEGGEIRVLVGDQVVNRLAFPAKPADALTIAIPEPEKNLKPGKNAIRIEMEGKNQFPYTVGWSYHTLQPISATGCPVKLTTALSKTTVKEGDSVRLNVRVENTTDQGQGMAVAIIGLPGGLVLPEDLKQLKEHKREPKDGSRPLISTFEIRGRELILYWRDLGPKQVIEVPIDLSCRYPGEYSGPASRAYLYYNGDHKMWVEPLKVMVTPSE